MDEDINKAVSVLAQGGIIVFPTDTAFGIGCRIDRPESVRKLFALRKRPESKAVPVLVDSIETAEIYLHSPLPNNVRHLMKDYWPGGVTVIYESGNSFISPLVRGGGNTLGVRMPDHEVALAIIKKTGVPVLGPSANFHGDKTPYNFSDLDPDLLSRVDFVVRGKCKYKNASTVIDVSTLPWRIVRTGAATVDIDKYENG